MKCFLSHAHMEGKISNPIIENTLQIKLFTKKKEEEKCHRIMSGAFTRLGKWVKTRENKIPPEEEVDLGRGIRSVPQTLQADNRRRKEEFQPGRVHVSGPRLGSIWWMGPHLNHS